MADTRGVFSIRLVNRLDAKDKWVNLDDIWVSLSPIWVNFDSRNSNNDSC